MFFRERVFRQQAPGKIQFSGVPPWRAPIVDYREVLARRLRYMPLTAEGVAALVEAERHAKVMNWISEGLQRRAHYATPRVFRLNPDGTLDVIS
jgi:hypothetical protein